MLAINLPSAMLLVLSTHPIKLFQVWLLVPPSTVVDDIEILQDSLDNERSSLTDRTERVGDYIQMRLGVKWKVRGTARMLTPKRGLLI
jgi:hypothetical protein